MDKKQLDSREIILDVQNLNTSFIVDRRPVHIVKGVCFSLKRGHTLAVVGESGCGKSVTMNSLLRFLGRNARVKADRIQYNSLQNNTVIEHHIESIKHSNGPEMHALRGPEISMVFQDPMSSLNPVYKVGDQVAEGLLQHNRGMSRAQAREKVLEMFRKLGIPDPEERIDCYPHQFSGGMKQRVVIAIAMICNPQLIICDEPTTALDVTIQAQIMDLLKEMQIKDGKSIILITHNMGLVAEMADEVCVMYMGRVVEFGSLEDIFDRTAHPYTRALLRSVPVLGLADDQKLETIPGATPNPADLGSGCEFASRCPYATDACQEADIPMYGLSSGHRVRCLRYGEYPMVRESVSAPGEVQ